MKKALLIAAGIYGAGYALSVMANYHGQKKAFAANGPNNDNSNKPDLTRALTSQDALLWPVAIIAKI